VTLEEPHFVCQKAKPRADDLTLEEGCQSEEADEWVSLNVLAKVEQGLTLGVHGSGH
jgi:hypothetical protein